MENHDTDEANMPSKEEMERQVKANESLAKRQKVRRILFGKKDPKTGLDIDLESYLGTISDASQLLILDSCITNIAMDKSNSFSEFKENRKQIINEMKDDSYGRLLDDAKEFLEAIGKNEIVLPFMVKTGNSVLKEVGERATNVVEAISVS